MKYVGEVGITDIWRAANGNGITDPIVLRALMKDFDLMREELAARDAQIAALTAELDKWSNWQPGDDDLRDMQTQARSRDGSYTNGRAAPDVYIGGLEARNRLLTSQIAAMIDTIDHAFKRGEGDGNPYCSYCGDDWSTHKCTFATLLSLAAPSPAPDTRQMDAVRSLIAYRDRVGPTGFQLEKFDDYINALREA